MAHLDSRVFYALSCTHPHRIQGLVQEATVAWLGKSTYRPISSVSLTISQTFRFFRFVFLARSWTVDRAYLSRRLKHIAKRSRSDDRFSMLIFPEGAFPDPPSRVLSKRYADGMGIVA